MGVFANSNVCQIDLQVNADYDIGKVRFLTSYIKSIYINSHDNVNMYEDDSRGD